MPRTARAKSKSGVYHIMLRGNEKRDIYIDDEDRQRFIETLGDRIKKGKYSLYAYCLMDNHIHMLIRESDKSIAELIRRVAPSYVYYFNKKYERIGHLFQDRYKSEQIETDAYLLSAVRYIHKNPVKAGIVSKEIDYQWSSFKEYINTGNSIGIIDTEHVLGMFSHKKEKAVKTFLEYSGQDEAQSFIDNQDDGEIDKKCRISRKEALQYIEIYLRKQGIKVENLKFKAWRDNRLELITYLRENSTLSIREIADMLKVNRGIVQRIKV